MSSHHGHGAPSPGGHGETKVLVDKSSKGEDEHEKKNVSAEMEALVAKVRTAAPPARRRTASSSYTAHTFGGWGGEGFVSL